MTAHTSPAPSDAATLRERAMLEAGLTLREARVLQGISLGRSSVQMSMDLLTSESCIVRAAREARRKLHATTDAHAVAEAMRKGWLA